ncbi:MAG TPA: heavy metal translocating P-type ATPase [Syntrophomonadaceae bacterium]|nr:heavy metal translocating P-type ATPase [Syntrophomonadaceae bacterium]
MNQNDDHHHSHTHAHTHTSLPAEPAPIGTAASPQNSSSHGAHDRQSHQHHDPDVFKQKFWAVVLLTIPVLVFSEHFMGLLGLSAPHFTGSHYIPAVFGILVFIVGGMVFIQGGINELRNRQPGMMTLIMLAIMVSFGYSLLVTLGLPGQEIFWELATLIDIMLLGHWLELRAVQNAGSAVDEMARLLPDTAYKVQGEKIFEVPVTSLRAGDELLVRPGGRIPADGRVIHGESQVNQSMVTGESVPVAKKAGDEVIAGTINAEGSLRIQVVNTGDATYLAGIMRLVEEAQRSKSRSQLLADRAALWLVIIAVTAALVTAVAWGISGAPSEIIMERVVTVMVAACPHALGLAIPLVIAISTSLSAQSGLLVRNRLMFEAARDIDYVVFDKTGTLTEGRHQLTGIIPAPGITAEEVLRLAASAEYEAEHMLAQTIVNAAQEKNLDLLPATSFESMPGRGITARIEGRQVQVGGPNLLALAGTTVPPELTSPEKEALDAGQTLVYLLIENQVKGLLTLADRVKEESREAIEAIKSMGIKVAMLTGDNEKVAARTAGQLGITEYFAGVLPENKAAVIKNLQGQGYRAAMVGDGVNDAPALVQADVGIAIGAGTDVAVESAGIVLVRSDPRDVARLITISRATYRKMIQNLGWATAYNIVVIPLAAGVLAPWGFVLPMAAGAVVMSLSTIIVAVNAQLLRGILPTKGEAST